MSELRVDDRDWRGGRVFSLVYSAGTDVHDLLERAATLYSAENALNTAVFPSLGRMQRDIVTITAGLLGADRLPPDQRDGVRGYLTSGGTESLLQATKTARDWGRAERGVDRPNMVLATTAHAAFEKAAHYFDVESRRVPVRADYSADVDAMADAVDDGTVMIVGSAPSYPQGVIDPIPELASIAARRGDPLPRRRLPRGLHPPLPRPARTPGQALGPVGARSHLDLRRPPQVRLRHKGISVILYRRPPAGRPPALRHHQLARRPLRFARRWPAPVPPARSPPAGPCSTTWAPTAISTGRGRPPGGDDAAGRRHRDAWAGAPGSSGRHRVRLRGRRGRSRHLCPRGCVGRPGRLVLRPPDPARQPPRHRAGRAPAGRRRAVRRPGRGGRRAAGHRGPSRGTGTPPTGRRDRRAGTPFRARSPWLPHGRGNWGAGPPHS